MNREHERKSRPRILFGVFESNRLGEGRLLKSSRLHD